MRDELVASATPETAAALAAGHQLYAAEFAVTRYREQRDQFSSPKLRARHAERLAEAAWRRDELDRQYQAALALVCAISPVTAEHVEDAVWRAFLVEEADAYCWVCGDDGHQPSNSCLRAAGMAEQEA